jgi:two-component system sensor histidine kinase SenX3
VSVLGYVAVGLAGVALGWLVSALINRRRAPRQPVTVVAEPALESTVLRLSTTGYLVMNQAGRPLLSNPSASELGVLHAGIVDQQIVAAAARAAVSGEPIDVELRPVSPTALLTTPRNAPTAVLAIVRAIGDGLFLVSAADESAAQRMEAARRDFVANVSHELKTPVAAMGLLAEVTVEAADDPAEVRRFAGKLQAEAVRLGALVNELIALSRLQGADPLPDLAVVEVDAVIDETISRVTTAAENAGITLISDARSGLLVRGDRSLLVTALTNLVDNAINYSPAGTQVSVSRTMRDGEVQIAVTDRGVGIAPEFTERVFERFFRIDPARSRSTGGTGLGLAIVKHVAANHGGSATVWSRPGTGSTFTLRLPALEQFGPGSESAAAGTPSRTAAPGASGLDSTKTSTPTAVSVHRGVQ